MVDGDRRIYFSRRRRWLIATSLVALLLGGSSLIFEKDPDTGLLPVPGDYLWVVIPGAILILVLAWRALKVQVVTDRRGVEIVRVVGRERVPWSRLRSFEVHPTPGKQGSVVLARTDDEVLVKISSEVMIRPVRDRDGARRLARIRSDALAKDLEEDRRARRAELVSAAAAKTSAATNRPAGTATNGPAGTATDRPAGPTTNRLATDRPAGPTTNRPATGEPTTTRATGPSAPTEAPAPDIGDPPKDPPTGPGD
jgi:hypothetical protein